MKGENRGTIKREKYRVNELIMGELDKIKKEIEKLREQIRDADYKYYVLSEPEISDKEYDDILKQLKGLEEKYPQLITPDSPTQRVSGGLLEGFPTVEHKIKMISLDNTYSIEELKDWENKIKRILKRDVYIDYVVELKIDGVSCALTYEKGMLLTGATRGDGTIGEDITTNVKTIKSVPLRLRGDAPEVLEVRGEIYMDKKDLENINKMRLKLDEQPFANPRNAASGSLKLLDPSIVKERNLKCFIHSSGLAKGVEFKNHYEFFEKIKALGLRINPYNKLCKDLDEVIEYCLSWQSKRDSLEYEIDGIVVKVNDYRLRKELAETLKSPRWAVAYKFPAHQATTTVQKIEFGVGRTGIITPVAILKPVECAGVTISRSTLHNFDEIERLDVREGDTVLIERAGEVIPKIVKVITTKRKDASKKIKVPMVCPVCRQKLAKEKEEEVYPVRSKTFKKKASNGVYWYCINPDCPAKIKQSLLHFASRGAMDIEGMGESVVEELVNRNLVKSLADIYKITKEDLLKLPLFAQKKADNLILAIAVSKKRQVSRLLYALGMHHIGEKAASLLADKFKKIDMFFKLKKEDLERISEIGPVMASSVIKFFASAKAKKLIEEFKKSGLNLSQEEKTIKQSSISGKVFIFTGELKSFSRSQAKESAEALGAKCAFSISKNIDYVVVGENPGSKYEKAKKLHLNIITEQDFKKLI
ncbi:MAG: NAD-dependent DNA ligase LigA, partial [Candidatus Omnitrophica bacterium]|nr:NAD-dependent DNA ligase LigA [Candidatus Omnitrophota bacterium]